MSSLGLECELKNRSPSPELPSIRVVLSGQELLPRVQGNLNSILPFKIYLLSVEIS